MDKIDFKNSNFYSIGTAEDLSFTAQRTIQLDGLPDELITFIMNEELHNGDRVEIVSSITLNEAKELVVALVDLINYKSGN